MKKILIILILLNISFIAFANDNNTMSNYHYFNSNTNNNCNNQSMLTAGRGCCSHHGGVCGCSNGRALCCDGTLSPSCGCMQEKIEPAL